MMRKLCLVVALIIVAVWLAGCGSPTTTPPPATSTPSGPVVVDQSLATPMVGTVTVLNTPGKASIFLLAQPNAKAVVMGKAKPGDTGTLLGLESTGQWMLVEINQQTGWVPVQYLDYTIAQ